MQIPQCEGAILKAERVAHCEVWDSAVGCAEMAGPMEMLFGTWTWVVPRNHVLDGGEDPLT